MPLEKDHICDMGGGTAPKSLEHIFLMNSCSFAETVSRNGRPNGVEIWFWPWSRGRSLTVCGSDRCL